MILLPWAGLPWMLAFVIRALRERRVEVPGALRDHRPDHRQRQRDRADLRGHRAGALDPVRGLGPREVTGGARSGSSRRSACSRWSRRCGGWPASGRRAATGSTSSSTRRRCRPCRGRRCRTRCCAASATGSSTAATSSVPGSKRATPTPRRPVYIIVSYGVAVLALFGGVFVRWRHRAYFILITLVGVVIAVGAHPYDNPTPFGQAVQAARDGVEPGSRCGAPGARRRWSCSGSRRCSPRGSTRSALARDAAGRTRSRSGPRARRAGDRARHRQPPRALEQHLLRQEPPAPEDIPQYWKDAGDVLDARPHDTRVLELPGSDFASYRWGNTVDPITPGIMDRPYVARELIPYGSPASANLLNAFDLRIQDRQLTRRRSRRWPA